MSDPITPSQVRSIHVAVAALGLADADYRGLLRRRYGVDSCKGLDRRQASDLLASLGRPPPGRPGRGGAGRGRRRSAPNVVALATAAQRRYIAELAERVEWRAGGGLAAWMKASLGIEAVRTVEEASAVIEGLKAMCRRAGRHAG